MDEGGTGGQGELTNGEALPTPDPGNDNLSDEMSEPTELQRIARQLQLDAVTRKSSTMRLPAECSTSRGKSYTLIALGARPHARQYRRSRERCNTLN